MKHKLKRYSLQKVCTIGCNLDWSSRDTYLARDPDGEWVRYDDVKAYDDLLEAAVDALRFIRDYDKTTSPVLHRKLYRAISKATEKKKC